MDKLSIFESKLLIAQEIQDLQADLRVSISCSKDLAKLSSETLLEMRDQLKKGHETEFF